MILTLFLSTDTLALPPIGNVISGFVCPKSTFAITGRCASSFFVSIIFVRISWVIFELFWNRPMRIARTPEKSGWWMRDWRLRSISCLVQFPTISSSSINKIVSFRDGKYFVPWSSQSVQRFPPTIRPSALHSCMVQYPESGIIPLFSWSANHISSLQDLECSTENGAFSTRHFRKYSRL